MITSWRDMNAFIDLKYDEGIEQFFLAYLNVLYESRRYFINKRCNKQDGTLWACRHLEKMIPQMVACVAFFMFHEANTDHFALVP